MADVILHDGKEITLNLYSFTYDEYMEIFGEGNEQKADALVAKCAGLTAEELKALPYPDNRKIYFQFFKKCREVTQDPNSESAST